MDQSPGHGLGQQLVKEILAPSLLLQVVLSPFLHQTLQVVGVLLHPVEKVVHDVAGLLPVGPLDDGPCGVDVRPVSRVLGPALLDELAEFLIDLQSV